MKKTKMNDISFTIRPDKSGLWKRPGAKFNVLVLPNQKAVTKYRKDVSKKTHAPTTIAFYWNVSPKARKKTGFLGEIVLPATKWLGSGLVAHEATHAALTFLSWQLTGNTTGKFFMKDGGENLCLAVENIVREITIKLFRYKIWK